MFMHWERARGHCFDLCFSLSLSLSLSLYIAHLPLAVGTVVLVFTYTKDISGEYPQHIIIHNCTSHIHHTHAHACAHTHTHTHTHTQTSKV